MLYSKGKRLLSTIFYEGRLIYLQFNRSKFKEKLSETLKAVFPIIAIVLFLCFTISPISPSILLAFVIGAVLLVVGMLLFSIGAELAMTPMGERVGTTMTKSRNLPLMVLISFAMGFIITISEPDLQVLAEQVPSVPNMTLILAVALGVGFFLVVAVRCICTCLFCTGRLFGSSL